MAKKRSKKAQTFSIEVDVPEPTAAQKKARAVVRVVQNRKSSLALELRREDQEVVYIPLPTQGSSFVLERMEVAEFAKTYNTILDDYPVGRAAQLFVGFCVCSGAPQDVVDELGKLVTIKPGNARIIAERYLTHNAPRAEKRSLLRKKKVVKKAAKKPSTKPEITKRRSRK